MRPVGNVIGRPEAIPSPKGVSVSSRCPHGARYGYTMACDVTACQDLGRLLARREHIAVKALAGLLAGDPSLDYDTSAKDAVKHADALLARLEE